MVAAHYISLPLLASTASAANLWATHYSGTINYLTFTDSLALTHSIQSGNKSPSWITYDNATETLYIAGESSDASAGNLVSFAVGEDGALTDSKKGLAPTSGVATALYGGKDGKGFIAIAHYSSSQLSTFKLPLDGGKPLQTLNFTMDGPGPIADRQDKPHPHHVIVDPTGDFLVVPDLGADLLRIFKLDKSSGSLTECPSVKSPPGTGPRHGVFRTSASSRCKTQAGSSTSFYVANELASVVTRWSVSYPYGGCLALNLQQTLTPYQGNSTASNTTYVAEIQLKDNSLYISNRGDQKFSSNDSITQYTITANGSLTWTDNTSSYGTFPRTFAINKAGDYVAMGDQISANVAIVARDQKTGKLGKLVANLRVGDAGKPQTETGVSAVVWAE